MTSATARPALRALASITDLPLRVGAVARRARARPATFVADLESLLATSRSAATADVSLACAFWLLNAGASAVPELQDIAVREGRVLVGALLADVEPHRALASGGRLPELGIHETATVVSHMWTRMDPAANHLQCNGVRYTPPPEPAERARPEHPPTLEMTRLFFEELLARYEAEPSSRRRMPSMFIRKQVARLAQHHSPFAIGRLLDDPLLRDEDVVTVAARRPTTPAIVRELTSRLRWMQVPSVRAALVANPFTPSRVSLILAATHLPRRAEVVSGNVHPRVRELALRIGT